MGMQFSVNATRFDPYKNFKFRVKWDGKYVAGVSKVGALKRSTELVEHREGGDPSTPRKSPGRNRFEAITLERGVTHDPDFERWANRVSVIGAGLGAEVSLKDFRKDIIIEVYNEAGQLALAYKVYRCWVSEFQSLPDLDANADAVAIQLMKLENEGWERDEAVTEPTARSFTRSPSAGDDETSYAGIGRGEVIAVDSPEADAPAVDPDLPSSARSRRDRRERRR